MDDIPNYIKYFFILSNIALTVFIIIHTNFIINPLITALIVSILLSPLYNKLVKIGIPRILSASTSVLIFVLAIVLLLTFITSQLKFISADPALSAASLIEKVNSSERWLARLFRLSYEEHTQAMEGTFSNFVNNIISYAPSIFSVTTTYLSMFLLFFISLFFFLYYRNFFMLFIVKLSGKPNEDRINETADKIEVAIKNYIVGLFFVISIIAVLNTLGLLMVGAPHAAFFGILGALLTLIPYIGILIGALLPATYAFITTDSLLYPIGILLIFSFVQFLEGNFITPNIIGKQENINPYIAILGLFIGGMLLGAVGIILAIPLLGIAKIICDDIDYLKPIGYVMGNPRKESNTPFKWFSNLFNRK